MNSRLTFRDYFSYHKLSYRKRFLHTLYDFPLGVFICVVLYAFNVRWYILFLVILYISQLLYNLYMWKRQTENSGEN